MKKLQRAIFCLFILCFFCTYTLAQKTKSNSEVLVPKDYKPLTLVASPELDTILRTAVIKVLSSSKDGSFKPDEIAATLIDLRDLSKVSWANVRGEEKIYPASVVKMFYLAALERQLEDGKIKSTPELMRGLKDMIVDSSNEATQYILDVITNTSSGAELPQKEFDKWQFKRNRVNRFFESMGYSNINVDQKTFCEDAYGIEQQSRKYKGENRNMLTTNAVARLLAEIVSGRMNTPERTRQMMDLMHRDPFAETKDQDDQAHGFTGRLLFERKMADAKLW